MRLIEPAQKPGEQDSFKKIINRINQLLPFGKTDEHAEDAIIARFMRVLDNRFIMIRNLPLEDTEGKFPLIIVGPTGLVLVNVSPAQGFFKARDDSWWEMSKTTHRYGPGRPNLIKQSQEYAQQLAALLDKREKSHPEVVPALVFANPGVHIETTNPAIRIVLMDGVESLISDILNSEEVLAPNDINLLADAFELLENPEKAIPMGEGEDFFGRDLLEPEKKPTLKLPKVTLPKVTLPTNLSLPPVEEKFKFSSRQWLIIEILMVLTIVVLVGGIIYVLLIY